jgi:hypothetical protein
MPAVLFVRIRSGLDRDELDRRLLERRPRFREVPGLLQKVYGRDRTTGDVCGIYFFESEDALEAFRESELARTIPSAYEAIDVRREVYDVLYTLWSERGPFVPIPNVSSASGGGAPASDPRR